MDEIEDLKRRLTAEPKKRVLRAKDLLSTGSTTVNLALSGRAKGGLYKGMYYLMWGDSDSGKTWLSMTCFAEASINPNFDGYRFIHDNPEDGALMDVSRFFGDGVNGRIEPPAGTREDPQYSYTVEDFLYNIDDALAKGTPFIWVLDSFDALDTEPDIDKFRKQKRARRKVKEDPDAKEEAGSYGTAKAKAIKRGLRLVANRLKKSGSILIIICQAIDAIGWGKSGKARSGGRALKFYAQAELVTSMVGTITKNVRGRDRKLGIKARVEVKKNRHTGRKVEVEVPIYWSFGIDDTGSCIDFLVLEKHWPQKKGQGITAPELGVTLPRDKLISHIEGNDLEPQLRSVVQDVWNEVRDACAPDRKRRYGK